MSEELYYVPQLSEFHEYFEYEVSKEGSYVGSKEIFHLNDSHINLVKYVGIQDEKSDIKIRVKFLDHQDCLDLGWIYNEKEDSYEHPTTVMGLGCGDDAHFHLHLDDKWHRVNITLVANRGTETERFEGSIKNKSELKTLMEQLGVGKRR